MAVAADGNAGCAAGGYALARGRGWPCISCPDGVLRGRGGTQRSGPIMPARWPSLRAPFGHSCRRFKAIGVFMPIRISGLGCHVLAHHYPALTRGVICQRPQSDGLDPYPEPSACECACASTMRFFLGFPILLPKPSKELERTSLPSKPP